MNLLEELQKAADRGVDVTIITNDRESPALRFKWRFWNTRDSGCGEFRAAGYELVVRDCDGDMSWWELRRGGRRNVIAKGETYECTPYYHFDQCCLEAEAALIAEIRARLANLRGRT